MIVCPRFQAPTPLIRWLSHPLAEKSSWRRRQRWNWGSGRGLLPIGTFNSAPITPPLSSPAASGPHAMLNWDALVKIPAAATNENSNHCNGTGGAPAMADDPAAAFCDAVTIFTNKHGVDRGEEEASDMYPSIDNMSNIIRQKLQKIKEKDGGRGRPAKDRHIP